MLHNRSENRTSKAVAALAILSLVAIAGCSRAYYRKQADQDVRKVIAQAAHDPRWALPHFTIKADPRSRYFDPTNPDCPPMPPDDPAAHRYMHCVDGMKGWPCWDECGFRCELENPRWKELLGTQVEITPEGEIRLDLDSSLRLALIHSPDYRQQIETLYLSALDVTAERFRFDVQFFAGNDTFFTHLGENRTGAGEQNILSVDNDLEVRKQFATGAELLIGFANSFVWQFAGPDTNSAMSLLNFSLVQPLLRGGGRVIALERLTIVERSLLANLRAFKRYQQGFYTEVAIGDLGVAGPQRRGGFFGGTGLTGFTGLGAGGFGAVGQAGGFRGGGGFGGGADGGGAGFAGGGAGTVGGFIGLLQQLQQVRNTLASLSAQTQTLGLLEANLEAGLIDIAQVDQFRQNIETERANLLQARNALTNSLENFKTSILGLPPDLPVELDDSLIRQFRFIDPRTTAVENAIEDFTQLIGDLPEVPSVEELTQAFAILEQLQERLLRQFVAADADLEQLDEAMEVRRRTLSADEMAELQRVRLLLAEGLEEMRQRVAELSQQLEAVQAGLTPETVVATTDRLVEMARVLSGLAQELSLVQARARLESVTLEEIELLPDVALKIARANRLDWMNNRAALVDTWRLIAFNANALQSGLDIVFSGDVGTTGDNPLNFQGSTGTLRAGLRFDAPLTRLLERNNYRAALIDYAQDRRQLIEFEDGVNRTLRRLLRQLNQLSVNLEIQRRAMVIAVRRVDQTREVLNRPPDPVQPGQPAAQLGPTAAQNLLTALSDLRNTQNNFMSVWLNYYATRMVLMRELGIMELDEHGRWIDRELDPNAWPQAPPCPLPPDIPLEWLDAAGVDLKEVSGAEKRADRDPLESWSEPDDEEDEAIEAAEPEAEEVHPIPAPANNPRPRLLQARSAATRQHRGAKVRGAR